MVSENKKYYKLLIIFIIILFINLSITNLILSFLCATIFFIISLKEVFRFFKKNLKVNAQLKRQALIYNGIVLMVSTFWIIRNIIILFAINILVKLINKLPDYLIK